MKKLIGLAFICLVASGCEDIVQVRVASLERQNIDLSHRIDSLQNQINDLADASINNSKAIKNNSESIKILSTR